MTDLVLNPDLRSLSTPFWPRDRCYVAIARRWAPERARVMPPLPKLLLPALAPALAPIPALTPPLLQIRMLTVLVIPIPQI